MGGQEADNPSRPISELAVIEPYGGSGAELAEGERHDLDM